MSDIVERLRDQGEDAFAKQYSLGMWKLCTEAADEIEPTWRAMIAALPASPSFDRNAADALRTIADIAEGSGTLNSLPNIAKIARSALAVSRAGHGEPK